LKGKLNLFLNWYKTDIYPGINTPMIESRRALGAFLRAHRERIRPPSVQGRRRTPGLRREEVAGASGVSTTWYTWLEQGRDISPSPAALARLADTLQLAAAERAYLFELARRRDPVAPEPQEELPSEVLALPGHLAIPAYVLDRTWTVRAWNTGAARLFAGWLDGEYDRNLLVYIFLSPFSRRLIDGWEERSRRVVAEFRADYSRQVNDPAINALIEALTRQSPAFRRCWQEQVVLRREGGERRFNHPHDGPCRFLQSTLVLASDPGIKLVTLEPAG
jgi:transcriptional regulator with XRE-family HTH domain